MQRIGVSNKQPSSVPALALAACLAGCQGGEATADSHACAEAWGALPEATVYVGPDGLEGAAGTLDDPFPGMDEALAATRAGLGEAIAILPGRYPASKSMDGVQLFGAGETIDDIDDSGLVLAGCGAEETVLEATEADFGGLVLPGGESPPIWASFPPALSLQGSLSSVSVRSLGLAAGLIGVMVRGSVGVGGEVVLSDLRISESMFSGVLVNSLDARITLRESVIENLVGYDVAEDLESPLPLGVGISAVTMSSPWFQSEALLRVEGVRVEGAVGLGVALYGIDFEATGLEVLNTQPSSGMLGRGIHLSDLDARLDGVVVRGSHDSGIFLDRVHDVSISNSTIQGTGWADNPQAEGDRTADGLVVYEDPEGPPSTASVTLVGNRFVANGRVGVLAHGASVILGDGNSFEGNLLPKDDTFPLLPDDDTVFLQAGATLSGLDGASPPLDGQSLGEGTGFPALSFHDFDFSMDALPSMEGD